MKVNLKIVAGVGATMLLAGNASAAVLTATAANYSKEGVTTTGNVTLPTITAILAADYKADDRISLSIGGGAAVVAATDLTAAMSCSTGGISVGFLNRDGNTVNFRVTQILEVNNLGATCTISGIQVTKSSVAASTTVTGSYSARTVQGEVIDTGCANPGTPGTLFACDSTDPDTVPNLVTLATVKSQFSAKLQAAPATPFNNVIDVEQDRLRFTTGDRDTTAIEVKNLGTLLQAVTVGSAKYVITGNFGFAGGNDGDCTTADTNAAPAPTSAVVGATLAYAKDCQSLTVTYPAAAFPAAADTTVQDTITVILPALAANKKLNPQTFASTYTFGYPTDKTAAISFSAGAWTINGALVFVPYMPYGDNISQIIYIANRGSQNGDISIDAFDESGASYSFDVGQVAGGSVRKLTAEILAGLATAGFGGTGRVAFEMTVNAPADDIDVYSAYNVGGSDRGTVVNSQNGRAKTSDSD